MSNLVQYEGYDLETADQDEQFLQAGAEFMKLEVGRNVIRFIPARPGEKVFLIYYRHFINKPDGSKAAFACPARMYKKPCPACQFAEKLTSTGNAADIAVAKKMFPTKRGVANVIDRKNPDKGPQILEMAKTVVDTLVKIRKNEDAGGDFVHPMTGFDICIERTGTGQNDTEYKVIPSRKNSQLAPTVEQMNEWITKQPNLGPRARLYGEDEIKEMLAVGPAQGASAGRQLPAGKPAGAEINMDDFGDPATPNDEFGV